MNCTACGTGFEPLAEWELRLLALGDFDPVVDQTKHFPDCQPFCRCGHEGVEHDINKCHGHIALEPCTCQGFRVGKRNARREL